MAGIADLLASIMGGEAYQSNGQPLMANGRLNWGDPDSSADFARANQATRGNMPAAAQPAFTPPLPPPRPPGIGGPVSSASAPSAAGDPSAGPGPAVPQGPPPVDVNGMRRMAGAAMSMEPEPGYSDAPGQVLQQALQPAPMAAMPEPAMPNLPIMAQSQMPPLNPSRAASNSLPPEVMQIIAQAFGVQSRGPSLTPLQRAKQTPSGQNRNGM